MRALLELAMMVDPGDPVADILGIVGDDDISGGDPDEWVANAITRDGRVFTVGLARDEGSKVILGIVGPVMDLGNILDMSGPGAANDLRALLWRMFPDCTWDCDFGGADA